MRLLFIGDVVGRAGRAVLLEKLPEIRRRWALDFVVVNGENAAGGFGITEAICDEFLAAGADCVTLGNHAFDQREALVFIERQERLIRPVNYPPGTPGRGSYLYEGANGHRVLVCNVLGRVFMDAMDDPFAAIEREIAACPLGLGCDAAIFDVHAEASSEKQAIGHFLDGRVSLVVGTHTHVPTADAQILPAGTAYQTDVGMSGPYESIIGRKIDRVLAGVLSPVPCRFDVATGDVRLHGALIEIDPITGKADRIVRVRIDQEQARRLLTDPTSVAPY